MGIELNLFETFVEARSVFMTLTKVKDGAFFAKTVNGSKLLTIFAKKYHRRYMTGS